MSSDSRFALSLRAVNSRFNRRPGCTTGAMLFNLCGSRTPGYRFVRPGYNCSKTLAVVPQRARPETTFLNHGVTAQKSFAISLDRRRQPRRL